MKDLFSYRCSEIIRKRFTPDGGIGYHTGDTSRADSTCWGSLALRRSDSQNRTSGETLNALARTQRKDGSIPVTPEHPEAFWTTPLAILAWHSSAPHEANKTRAIRFLLSFDHVRLADNNGELAIIGHDTAIKGWPWIAHTSPWLEPTAYCLMALELAGFGGHERTVQAQRLLVDRQLPAGGWNYGNTFVYGQQLRPMPETTGMALQALAKLAAPEQVTKSIDYLQARLPHLNTPFSLAWTILGLAAWGESPDRRASLGRLIEENRDWETWDTVSLSLMVLAWHCENGLMAWLRQPRGETES